MSRAGIKLPRPSKRFDIKQLQVPSRAGLCQACESLWAGKSACPTWPQAENCKKQFTSEMFSCILILLWYLATRFGMETIIEGMLNRDEMERRRLEAAQDLLNGMIQSQVARKFGVSRTTASRWQRALKGSGVESLRKRRAPGRPSRLTREQLGGLAELMTQGAIAYGFPDERWTTARLSVAIAMRFGVRYDPDHVGRLMHKMGLRKADPMPMPAYAGSRYSPNTDLSRSEISPTVA